LSHLFQVYAFKLHQQIALQIGVETASAQRTPCRIGFPCLNAFGVKRVFTRKPQQLVALDVGHADGTLGVVTTVLIFFVHHLLQMSTTYPSIDIWNMIIRYHFTRRVGAFDRTSTGDGRRLYVQDPKEVLLGVLDVRRVLDVRGLHGLFVCKGAVKVEKKVVRWI
jgi:hypothetical protein